MLKIYRNIVYFTAIFCLSFASQLANAESIKTFRITNGEWQPYLSENVYHYGFVSHIITEAFALVGVEVEYGFFPWKRSMILARDGAWDAAAVWADTEERHQYFHFSEPVVPTAYAFFHRIDRPFNWHSFQDLQSLNVGATLEYSYGSKFDTAEKAGVFHTQRVTSDELNLKKLFNGRIDVFPGDVMVTYEQLRDNFSEDQMKQITHHKTIIHEDPLYLLISKKIAGAEEIRDQFNKGLQQLKESGRYQQIISSALAGEYAKKSE